MKSEDFYIDSNRYFENISALLNYKFKGEHSKEELEKLKHLCLSILWYDRKILKGPQIDSRLIKEYFMDMVRIFDNKTLTEYFASVVNSMEIVRDSSLKQGNASLNLFVIDDQFLAAGVVLPDTFNAYAVDVASFAHELGHLACYENKPKEKEESFECSETLPMLLEFFSFLFFQGEKGEESFLRGRLLYEKRAALSILSNIDLLNDRNNSEAVLRYLMYDITNGEKYLNSCDFACQLIDLFHEDRSEIIKQLSKVLLGEISTVELGNKLGIDTTFCKRLVKEYNSRK